MIVSQVPIDERERVNQEGGSPKELDVIASGVLNRSPKSSFTKNKNMPKVEFGMTYGRKKYLNILCLGDSAVTHAASMLEDKENVVVFGKLRFKEYTNKDGEHKTYWETSADAVIPVDTLMYLCMNANSILQLAHKAQQLLELVGGAQQQPPAEQAAEPSGFETATGDMEDDLPF